MWVVNNYFVECLNKSMFNFFSSSHTTNKHIYPFLYPYRTTTIKVDHPIPSPFALNQIFLPIPIMTENEKEILTLIPEPNYESHLFILISAVLIADVWKRFISKIRIGAEI